MQTCRCLRSTIIVVILSTTSLLSGCGGGESDPVPPTPDPTPAAANQPDPAAIEKALAAGQAYIDSAELDKATAILETLLDRAPSTARAHEQLGQIALLKAADADAAGRAQVALAAKRQAYQHYKQATELDDASGGLHHSAGVVAMTAGLQRDALRHFNRASELEPANAQHPLYAAQVLIQLKRLDDAIDALRRSIMFDSDEPTAHASLAMIFMEQKKFDDALHCIGEARELAPRDLRFRIQESRIHRKSGEPHTAIELLSALSAVQRADFGVAEELATAWGDLDEHIEASKVWAHCYEVRPIGRKAYLAAVHAGESLLKADEPDQAKMWAHQARVAGGDAPEVIALERALGVGD